jgi:replicative DNA helicase
MNYDFLNLREKIKDIVTNIGKSPFGLPSGIKTLDKQIRGFEKGDYVIVAGRPSMGKSSFAATIALEVGIKSTVAVFSLEMNTTLFVERMVANLANINYHKLKLNEATKDEWKCVDKAAQQIAERSILIDDTSRLYPKLLQQKLSYMQGKFGLDCCIIDYLQLMTMWRKESRQVEITDISREVKAISKDLNIPIIVLCQLSRAAEQRTNSRPRMSDLRESGSLEQDAHKVLMLYRPAYYGDEAVNEAEIIVAKSRSGPIGTIKVQWNPDSMKFTDIKESF